MALFAAGGITDDADGGGVAFVEGETGQSGDDGLQLVVVGRAIGGEGNERAQGAVGRGQIADFSAALGGERREAEGLPRRMGVAFDEHPVGAGVGGCGGAVAGIHAAPSAAAERVVDIEAELSEGAIGDGFDDAGETGFGDGVELALADARVVETVGLRLPGLRAIEHDEADAAGDAKMIEPSGEDVGVDGANRLAGGDGGNDLAGDGASRGIGSGGCCKPEFCWGGAGAIEDDDADIGPAAEGEIYGEDGHSSTLGPVYSGGQLRWREKRRVSAGIGTEGQTGNTTAYEPGGIDCAKLPSL